MTDSHSISAMDLMVVEQVVANEARSTAVAYLLLIFLGLVSAHRFYLGRPVSAVLQIMTYFIGVGFVWLFIDLFLLPGMVRQDRQRIRLREMAKLAARTPVTSPASAVAAAPASVDAALISSLLAEGPSA